MRFSITDSQKPFVPVSAELGMIKDFIAIEQIRYGARLRIKNHASGNFDELLIAPFLFYTLVENCFKHGSSADAGKPWIELSLACSEGRVVFETRNSTPRKYEPLKIHHGNGLAKLKKRLELIYPGQYKLTLKEGLEEFGAKLELDLN